MALNDPLLIDPSTLTTQQILREVAALEKLVEQRMDAIEKAVSVAHENLVRVPTEVDKAIGHLREVVYGKLETVNEKFSSVQTQFNERDVRVEQTARDTKVAVDAALAAQKEQNSKQTESFQLSINKSETATAKQIDQQAMQSATALAGIFSAIGDIKDRLTRIEGEGRGERIAVGDHRASGISTVGIIGLVFGSLIGVGGLVVAFIR